MICYGRRRVFKIIFVLIIINSISLFCYVFLKLNSLETGAGGVRRSDQDADFKNNIAVDNRAQNGRESTVGKYKQRELDAHRLMNEIQIQETPLKKKSSKVHLPKNSSSRKPWQQFQDGLTKDYMYASDAPYMKDLLDSLSSDVIKETRMFKGGTQVKLFFEFSNGNTALVKPMRMKIDEIYPYSSEYPFWLDPERHNAEIASFHLDRVLNFRRSVPVAGRLINMTKEILQKCNDTKFLDTFLKKDGNLCFVGVCVPWFCNEERAICGVGDMLEVSVAQFLPAVKGHIYPVLDRRYPWSQGMKESKVWKAANVCDGVFKSLQNGKDRTFLDLIDLAIFDFLIVNYDRHHYTMLQKFRNESFVSLLDNGKGFGNSNKDDITFLAPVYQCCKVRQSTYNRLKELSQENGSKLSTLMRTSLLNDALSPVLSENFLKALDRRLQKVLSTIQTCFMDHSEESVLVAS